MASLIIGSVYIIKKIRDEKKQKKSNLASSQTAIDQAPPRYQDDDEFLPQYQRFATPAQAARGEQKLACDASPGTDQAPMSSQDGEGERRGSADSQRVESASSPRNSRDLSQRSG